MLKRCLDEFSFNHLWGKKTREKLLSLLQGHKPSINLASINGVIGASEIRLEDISETDIPSSLILKRLLEVNLITLKDPPRNPNTSAPGYRPDAFCVYHSHSPGHDTDDCWTLKNKIQDLIDGRVLEFMPDGEMKIFC